MSTTPKPTLFRNNARRIYGRRSRFVLVVSLVAAAVVIDHFSRQPSTTGSTLTTTGIPPVPTSLKRQMKSYRNRQFTQPVDWAPDGRSIVVIGRINETSRLYRIARPGGRLHQLTRLNESVIGAWVCPDAQRNKMFFTHDSNGNENFQICSLRFDTLATIPVSSDSTQNDGVVWTNRGDFFAYSSNRRNGHDFDVWIAATDSPASPHCLIQKGGTWEAVDWSPDDRRLLVGTYVSRTSSRLFVFNTATRNLTPLTDTTDTVSQELGMWGPDGGGIFYTSDKATDFRCLHYADQSTGHDTNLTTDIHWDIREIALTRNRRKLAFTTNEHGFSQLYLMDALTFEYRNVPSLPRGIIGSLSFNPAGDRLLMNIITTRHPDDAYVLDLHDTTLTRWTNHDPDNRQAKSITDPVVVEYATFDSVDGRPRRIPCLVFKPTKARPPFPVLIMIHGGPETQIWPSFRPDVNFFREKLGIAVVAPNVRGSGGYGKNYLTLDNGPLRNNAVRDIGALLDWIGKQPDFDTTRIAVTGGSYGGFMSLASLARYGDRLRAGIDCYGISNFITFLEKTAPYRRDLRRVEYGDERDSTMRQFLLDSSPLTHADRIHKPLLIVQGANDPRVPLSESRQIAEAVTKNGSTVWFLVANDEGHGFRKTSNLDYQDRVTAMFLKKFLVSR